jgi:dihydropteroate synthase
MRYSNKFKLKAIKLKDKGIKPNKIFEDEGFDIKDKQKDYARKLINK